MLHLFYAVTLTSVYEVKAKDRDGCPSATKIALRGESHIKVGEKLEKSMMISIGSNLTAFIPEGSGWISPMTTVERRMENVNTFYHGGQTSQIVALFKSKKSAMLCFGQDNLQPYDSRWKIATKGVLAAIGENHPAFNICRFRELGVPSEFFPARA